MDKKENYKGNKILKINFSSERIKPNKSYLKGAILICLIFNLFQPTFQIIDNYYYNLKDKLNVAVGSLNSISTQIPFDYYYLNICKPEKLVSVSDNLGMLLSHEITYKSNYEINLNQISYCNLLCKNDFSQMEIELIKWMIRRDYKTKFYLDKLPAGYNLYPLKDKNNKTEIHYHSGIPLGYFDVTLDGVETFYMYNHFTFNVKVHYEKNLDKYTIVGFDVIPLSINHKISGYMTNEGVIQNTKKNGDNHSNIKDLNDDISKDSGKNINNSNTSTSHSIKEKKEDNKLMRILEYVEGFLKGDEKTEFEFLYEKEQIKNFTNEKNNYSISSSLINNKTKDVKQISETVSNYSSKFEEGNKNLENKNNENQDILMCANNKEEYNLNFFNVEKQILRNKIIFTYDVVFELSDMSISSRWDHYLHIGNDKINWYSLVNSSMVIMIISSVVVYIFMRSVKREIEIYNTRVTGEEFLDEFGWKQVSGDVFRKPRYPMLLSCFLGTGVQLFFMVVYTLIFSFFGFFKPESRGSLIYAMLLLFVFLGLVNGYVSSRFLKMFQGTNWLISSLFNAIFYPLFVFTIIFFINIFLLLEKSSAALKFTDILSLLLLWICCSMPLVILGSFIGIKNKPIKNPGKINLLPIQIPDKPWFLKLKILTLIGGILPFAAIFIQLVYIMGSIWRQYMYYLFGFLFIVLILLLITTSEISILINYVLLCKGDYLWWWKSFIISGSPALYVIFYSVYYFFTLNLMRLSSIIVYFGIMTILSSFVFFICGSFGFLATFVFLRKIYSMIKLD